MKNYSFILYIILLLSCSTGKDSGNTFSFTTPGLPGSTVEGITVMEDGEEIFYITSIRLFSNWGEGWTEGVFEASGKYLISRKNNGAYLKQIDSFELWDILLGEIRYRDKFYRDDDGLWRVKNRIDRLKELSRILQSDLGFNDFTSDIKELYPYLFPELYNFPEDFNRNGSQGEIKRAYGVNWRVDYTDAIFPEEFKELRNSGTLYRDAIEAPDIFQTLYNLNKFFNQKEFFICL